MDFSILFIKIIQKIADGSLEININDKPAFIINFFKNRIVVEVFFYETIILSHEKPNFFHNLMNVKKIAQLLKDNGITIVVVYDKKEIIILGKDANPKISKFFTRSKHIEIKNLNEIRKILKK